MNPRFLFVTLTIQPATNKAGFRNPGKLVVNQAFLSVNIEKPLMRFSSIHRLFLLAISSLVFFSCNEKEELTTASLNDYTSLAAGKYITYRLDSTVFTNFGRAIEVHKYQVKHQVDALITDNLGRPSYRVYRFIRDSAGLQPWQPNGTYFVTVLSDQLELIDDNLRVIKLHLPIKNGFSWKGNRHLPMDPFASLYDFNNDDNISDWDFFYDGDPASFSYQGKNYSDVITVEQADEAFNVPIINNSAYASINRSVERYSKGIGLVYRDFILWEQQPNEGNPAGPSKTGFGLTMWMIDHN